MRRVIRELVEMPCRDAPIENNEYEFLTNNYPSYKCLQRFHPGISKFVNGNTAHAALPSKYKITKWMKPAGDRKWNIERQDLSGTTCNCDVFIKTAPLLNPISFLRGDYTFDVKHPFIPIPGNNWRDAIHKINSFNNQAYVDSVCSFVVSRFREMDLMPNFALYYGGLTAIANNYKYTVTDDYESYRNHKWFWRGIRDKKAKLEIKPEDPDISELVLSCPFEKGDLEIESEDSDVTSELSSLASGINQSGRIEDSDLKSVDSLSSFEEEMPELESGSTSGSQRSETDSGSDLESEEPEFDVLIEIPDMPVALIYQEAHDGTMDELLDEEDEDGLKQGSKAWETKWLAWLWQVVAALSFLQKTIGFTHNDLHTNNIVWRETKKQYLYYRSHDGVVWKIPTYGKIFSIIDFGRAIFHLQDKQWISDDFDLGEDAGGQYNFGPIYDKSLPLVKPNNSFDLCRLSVSLIDGLFGDEKPKKSELFDLLWSWTLDKKGDSVFETEDGEERYPGFELYIRIAADCENAIPKDQLVKDVFERFIQKDKSVPKKETVYQI